MFSYPCREGAKPEGEEGIEDDESYRRQAAAALESQASSSCVRKNTTTATTNFGKKKSYLFPTSQPSGRIVKREACLRGASLQNNHRNRKHVPTNLESTVAQSNFEDQIIT
jgi:hypothetical protein